VSLNRGSPVGTKSSHWVAEEGFFRSDRWRGCGLRREWARHFDKLHSKANDQVVILFGFDILELDGDDCRPLRLDERKTLLQKLLRRDPGGIHYNERLAADGRIVFDHACQFGCQGIIAKRVDRRYRSGRSKSWLKIKKPKSPAMLRIRAGDVLKRPSLGHKDEVAVT
jgi:bifunctional non-homologous end joining protein LigD